MITTRHPELRCYMNLMALDSLPQGSTGPHQPGFRERIEAVEDAGFAGVQFAACATPEQLSDCRYAGLDAAASGRINSRADARALAEQLAGDGYECATLHVGWGLEDDEEAACLVESVLEASERWRIPLYIETHRATIFQDMWRTVGFVRRFPEVRVNGDFSHWYTGQEMVYGGFDSKLAFIAPVLERVRFLHGRIGNPGCIQVAIDAATPEPVYIGHFRSLWTECFRHFRRTAHPGDRIYFTPELLGPDIFYARMFPVFFGTPAVEESDRWEQSLMLKDIAEQCYECAATVHD